MILEIRIMMKSIRHFTYSSKICRENGVVPKGYCKGMNELVVLRPLTYCRKQSLSLNTTKNENIAKMRRKQVKIPQVMRNMIHNNYTD